MFRLGTLLLGGAIGAGLAMLMAPKTGQETTAQLRERVRGLKDQYGDVIEQGRIRATELVQSSRDVIEQTQTRVNTAIDRNRSTGETDQPTRDRAPIEDKQPPHQPH